LPIIGAKPSVRLKARITVIELNDSVIALPGAPLPAPVPADQKFLAMYAMLVPGGIGAVLTVAGPTREAVISGMQQEIVRNLQHGQLRALEEVEISL
jgi:hypothetical protein